MTEPAFVFTDETFAKLKDLCAIDVAPEDQAESIADLKRMLAYVKLLDEVDTSQIAPTAHVFGNMANTTRPDEIGHLLSREDFLSNCASFVSGLVKVPTVMKENS